MTNQDWLRAKRRLTRAKYIEFCRRLVRLDRSHKHTDNHGTACIHLFWGESQEWIEVSDELDFACPRVAPDNIDDFVLLCDRCIAEMRQECLEAQP